MNEIQKIEEMVLAYCEAVQTQDETAFRSLWARESEATLISIATVFRGIESIVRDFLLGVIQAKYASIHLIAEELQVSLRGADTAVVLFRYHTKCIRRDDGEPYGIAGVETQLFVREAGEWKLSHVHYSKMG